jgi:WD40 repeat protein
VWDLRGGQPSFVLEGHQGPVNSASFSADGTHVVTASDDGTARVWDGGEKPDHDPSAASAETSLVAYPERPHILLCRR